MRPIVPNLGGHLRDEEDVPRGRRFGGRARQILLAGDPPPSGSGDAGLVPSVAAPLLGLHGAGSAFELSFVFGEDVGAAVACDLDDVVGVGVAAGG